MFNQPLVPSTHFSNIKTFPKTKAMIIDCESTDCIESAFEDSLKIEGGKSVNKRKQSLDHGDDDDDDDNDCRAFKSKNLKAERRRRKKLSDRLLELRALVPIITNMTKATIISDAIDYIKELQKTSDELRQQILQIDASHKVKEKKPNLEDRVDSEQEMKKWGIIPEVQVTSMSETKLWIRIVFPKKKKKCGITKMLEAMSAFGLDLTDTTITTSKGAVLVTSSAEGVHVGLRSADEIKDFLMEMIRSI